MKIASRNMGIVNQAPNKTENLPIDHQLESLRQLASLRQDEKAKKCDIHRLDYLSGTIAA